MITSISRYAAALSTTVLGFIVLLLSAVPASAASFGLNSSCSATGNGATVTCSFPVLSSEFNAEINYVTAVCGSTTSSFNLQSLTVSATPPNASSPVQYAVAGNLASVVSSSSNISNNVANAGAIVAIYVKLNTQPEALIGLAPNHAVPCVVSISGTY